MKEYINKNKLLRLVSFLLDMVVVLFMSIFIFRILKIAGIQDVVAQVQVVHGVSEVAQIQAETTKLISLIEKVTIAIAVFDGIYDFLCYTLFHTTFGKWICKLKISVDSDCKGKEIISIGIRCIVKVCMMSFLGSIIFVLSGFAVVASPLQLSIQDRISKTKIVHR